MRDFHKHIGRKVTCSGSGDLFMNGELRPAINNGNLTLLKVTRGGMAYLKDTLTGCCYSVPPRNVGL